MAAIEEQCDAHVRLALDRVDQSERERRPIPAAVAWLLPHATRLHDDVPIAAGAGQDTVADHVLGGRHQPTVDGEELERHVWEKCGVLAEDGIRNLAAGRVAQHLHGGTVEA
jgi:hypothetical protein